MFNEKNLGIYIHIPFCKAKCLYCDFNSFACRDDFVPAYFNALKKEICRYSDIVKGYKVKTVFIGGGTPSYIDAHNIYEIVSLLKQRFDMDNCFELTIETNPGTVDLEKLLTYRQAGLNRLSMGLQASQNHLLKSLGRIHTAEEFEESYHLAVKAGFDNINVDLIFAIPGQSFEDWMETINKVTELKPRHLSCYSLIIEDGTVFGTRYSKGELTPVEDELDRKMYWYAVEKLNTLGYKHYEISNFSKEGFECAHNLIYWKEQEYIGIGAGAHSYLNGHRFNNIYNIDDYVRIINSGRLPVENRIAVERKDEISEFMMLGLRLVDGVSIREFEERFGEDVLEVFGSQIESLVKRGLIGIEKGSVKLTKLGFDLANQAFMEFV
ncbi:radical SAM family heme chaperone HemW [Acetivibrio mesophilus]|uniref:Heme chaperone HemW n=1 Tax=Acetivibrio mesophilus TaxID=2487273 RepID=A0A4Q0I4M1_9FIRM|nr:radical SAM family heme chaperone HemW [Acetivibrio mesophilus]ODM24884.1 coproporphyrinogen III oxidase [Clostridium sp. Bc-iso-3]RXE57872.1 oxygen-independent coproporphyrinogen III oxidase [Acetivibrio mesophilus]HHV30063.1 oxygen-independent coproporphyrinogen III oxidase [Clostridium sp.]